MDIRVVTNQIANGWHPSDLDTFLGANEETLVLWSRAMVKAGHAVTVHTSLRGTECSDAQGVWWRKLERFNPASYCDVLISFKTRAAWLFPTNAGLRIHWSNDVETPWSNGLMRQVDKFIVLSEYHAERMPWVPYDKMEIIPLSIDPTVYKPCGEKECGLAIYATSPDRGLETLLTDWPRIQALHPGLRLAVTYDWSRTSQQFRDHMKPLLAQDGVSRATPSTSEMLGLFQRAEYYFHLLNNPDSDLFGFGPTKAILCGAKAILPSVHGNGFRSTVPEYIPYADFLRGSVKTVKNQEWRTVVQGWDEIVSERWSNLISNKEAA